MGFEPTTPTLARLCSTPELHPHPFESDRPGGDRGPPYGLKDGRMQAVEMRPSRDGSTLISPQSAQLIQRPFEKPAGASRAYPSPGH